MAASETIIVTPEWKPVLQAHGLNQTRDIYDLEPDTVRARSGTSEVLCLKLDHEGTRRVVFLKKYWFDTIRKCIGPLFRGTFFGRSKVRKEYENLSWLRGHGLDAPEPVAYGEERRYGWLVRSWLMSAAVPHAVGLDSFLMHELPGRPREEQRRLRQQLIQKLAVYTRFMHDQKFVHHDYFWRNIILEGGGLDHFYLIDAHKGFPWKGSKDFRWRIADLACLDSAAPSFFRRTERLRFFLRYRNRSSLHPEDKKLIGRILGLAAPMRSRQLKRVRQSPGVEPSGSSPTDSAGDPDLPHG